MGEIDIRLQLSALWITLMLIYLLGDVIRIFSGDAVPGEMDGVKVAKYMWTLAAVLMLIPILMVMLSLWLPYEINRWANIIVSVGFFLLNLFTLHTYPSFYDKFLLVVSMVFNVITVLYVWQWVI